MRDDEMMAICAGWVEPGPDYRQQQELEEERHRCITYALHRVATGLSDLHDAQLLAAECGIKFP